MTRVPLSRYRPRWSAATAVVVIVLLALVLAGCGSPAPSSSPSSTSLPPSAAVGYWHSPADWPLPVLVCIRQIQGRYFLWLPPGSARAPLVVQGSRLIRHHYEHGREIEREEFWARPDGTLAVLGRLPREGGGFTTPPVAIFTKVTGSDAQLATELRALFAESTMDKQVEILLHAVFKWASQHGGAFPPRTDLLPGGAFWSWKGAPHLTNAVTGGTLVLGSEPGNFDFTSTGNLNGSYNCTISVHRGYGFPDVAQSEGGNQP